VRVVFCVEFVRLVRLRGELVSARLADVGNELFEVVVVFGETLREFVEQFWIHRGIADAHVVHRFDDAAAEEVRPHDVHEIAREVGILRRRQPVGEHRAAVLAGDIGDFRPEEFRRHRASTEQMRDLTAAGVEDDAFARVFGSLASNLAEKRGEAVVVVHRPAVERMVVALRALHPRAHENLRGVLRDFQRLLLDLIVVRRGVVKRAAARGEQLPHDFVDGHILRQLLVQPIEIEQRGLVAHFHVSIAADFQQLGKLHHPHLDELLPPDQFVHELVALLRVNVGEKAVGLFARRHHARDVEKDAAHEHFIAAQLRWCEAQLLVFGEDESVHVVVLRHVRPRVRHVLWNDDDLRADGERRKARHDKRLAALTGGDLPAAVDFRGGVVVRLEEAEVSDVAH